MGRDNLRAKDYLKQIERLDTIINNKLVEKAQWKAVALGITADASGERVQSSGNPQKMANAIDRCIDIDAEINRLIDKLVSVKTEITSTIEQLSPVEYDVLHKLYIQNMTFKDVAAVKDKSQSWATTVHGRALQSLQRLLDARKIV